MKRFLKGCLAFVIMVACVVPQMPTSEASSTTMQSPVIVALAYGTSAVDGANILNSVGSGYQYGYLDSDRNFIEVGYTTQTGISAVKTQNLYYTKLDTGFSGYTDITSSVDTSTAITVGCYHIQLPTSYETFDEATVAAASVSGGFVAWINGTYYVRIGAYLDNDTATTAMEALGVADTTIVGTSSYGMSVMQTGTSTVLFQFDPQGEVGLVCMPMTTGSDKAETWYSGLRYYGSFRFQRVSGGDIVVCNVVDEIDYVSCVLSQEMSDSWPLEALKAQAVAVRTYCATNYGRHSAIYADICNSTHCQAYIGCSKVGDNTLQAAQETAGVYAWYNGSLIEAYYYSCNGGTTESSGNVWYTSIPYLVAKEDPYEPLVASETGKYNWSVTYTGDQLAAYMNSNGYAASTIVDINVTARTDMGNVYSISAIDSNGKSWSFYKEATRTIYGLNSQNYSIVGGSGEVTSGTYSTTDGGSISSSSAYVINGDGTTSKISGTPYVITSSGTSVLTAQDSTTTSTTTTTTDTFTFTGSGWGHSVGMSQWGAYSMAKLGYDYIDILTFYYTGIEVY